MTSLVNSQDNVLDQAAAWIARLRAPDAGLQDRCDFADWLACSSAHGEAFDELLCLWEDLGAAEAMPLTIPDIGSRARAFDLSAWSWRGLAATAASCLFAAMFILYPNSDSRPAEVLRTAIGDHAQHQLADGSEIELNTNTVVEVRLSADARLIDITRGEAFFAVASDAARPFVAACGPATATALGTAFNVRCETDRTEVTVTEGVVRVALADDTAGMLVRAGEHLVFSHQTAQGALGQGEQDRRLAWLEHSLVFDEAPLIDVLDELQRYTSTSLRLTDGALAGLRVTGRFNVRDPNLVIRALTEVLPIEARQQASGQILILPAQG